MGDHRWDSSTVIVPANSGKCRMWTLGDQARSRGATHTAHGFKDPARVLPNHGKATRCTTDAGPLRPM
jgi:hypothetical protein